MGCPDATLKRKKCSKGVALIVLFSIFLYYFSTRFYNKERIFVDISTTLQLPEDFKFKDSKRTAIEQRQRIFANDWCQQIQHRVDWKRILQPCAAYLFWGLNKNTWTAETKTDATKSYISLWGIRPAGQFSRLGLRAVTADNRPKTLGGDSWRVRINGPSSISPTVIDHSNGTYEVIFLVLEPGQYRVQIVLEHTLCDGFTDPPSDWFIKGNSQGKYQPPDALPGNERPFLIQPLWGGVPLVVFVAPDPLLHLKDVSNWLNPMINDVCPQRCKYLWNGYGRWKGNRWAPYFNDSRMHLEQLPRRRGREGTLWIYGDSVGDFFYKSIVKERLCKEIFKQCKRTYNWVYRIPGGNLTIARLETDDLDFSIDKILNEISAVARNTFMDEDSVMILNLGLHYVQNVNFTSYMNLVDRVIDLFRGNDWRLSKAEGTEFRGSMIWKTTTAINMEKYGDPRTNARHSKLIRFLTYQRVLLYNAYATQAMCRAGFPVLDVFPISDSYANGTGLPHKPYDAVHYPNWVFESVATVLEQYFGG